VGSLSGDVGARDLLRDARVRAVEALHLARPDDVDTPEELEAIRG
jgi:CTP:molybdopterin cytidylyltransferase MocA